MSEQMDIKNRLRHLHALYEGEPVDDASRDADLEREIQELRQVKDLIDARPKHRPDPATVSTILAAARGDAAAGISRTEASTESTAMTGASVAQGPRTDRPPVAKQKSTILRIGAASALVAMLVAVVGILQVLDRPTAPSLGEGGRAAIAEDTGNPSVEDPTRDEEPPADRSDSAPTGAQHGAEQKATPAGPADRAPSRRDEEPLHDQSTARRSAAPVAGSQTEEEIQVRAVRPPSTTSKAVAAADFDRSTREEVDAANELYGEELSWDQRVDVMEVYEHIEMLGGGVEQGWEPPAVPLEMMPQLDSERQPFLRPAGERRSQDP